MALIKLGGLAQDVRGSLNGTVFSRNKGGAYTRSKVSPVQPVSDFASASRQAFKEASQSWASSLTDVERGAWIAFAAIHPFINVFGDSITLSGIAFFQAANKRLAGIGFPMIADAPVAWDVDAPGELDAVVSVNDVGAMSLLLNPLNAPSGPNISAYLFATTKIPNGGRPQKNQYRMVNPQDATVRDESYDWGPDYQTRFDPYTPAAGDKIGLLYAYIDTESGCISVASSQVVIAAAIPGPLITIGETAKLDAGGGDAYPWFSTNTPHGFTTGDTVTVAMDTPNAFFDGVQDIEEVTSPTTFYTTQKVGSAAAPSPLPGVVNQTA